VLFELDDVEDDDDGGGLLFTFGEMQEGVILRLRRAELLLSSSSLLWSLFLR